MVRVRVEMGMGDGVLRVSRLGWSLGRLFGGIARRETIGLVEFGYSDEVVKCNGRDSVSCVPLLG